MLSCMMRCSCNVRCYRKRIAASGQCLQWSTSNNTSINREASYTVVLPSTQQSNPLFQPWHTPPTPTTRFSPSPQPKQAGQPWSTVQAVQPEAPMQKSAQYPRRSNLIKAFEPSTSSIQQMTRTTDALLSATIPKDPQSGSNHQMKQFSAQQYPIHASIHDLAPRWRRLGIRFRRITLRGPPCGLWRQNRRAGRLLIVRLL